jgi:DNA-binding IclR family transcriptional regulator
MSDSDRPETDKKPDGTQAIRRAAAILRHIARGPEVGVSLREVAEAMELSRSTAHRILRCLLDEKLIEQGADSRRYVIGGLTFELGLAATNRQHEILRWRSVVDALAQQTGATNYLMGRSGNECVCLYKAEGSSVVRVIPVDVGQRRPLGVGAGATALLAATTDGDLDRVLTAITPYLERWPSITVDRIRDNVEAARKTGLAESRGLVVDGVYGLGVAIPAEHGSPMLALSLAAHHSAATDDRVALWRRSLLKALKGEV